MKKSASLPLEPLWNLVRANADLDTESFTQALFAKIVKTTDRTVNRWTADGMMPWTAADEAAVAIGLHPSLVWGDDWWNVKGDFEALADMAEMDLVSSMTGFVSDEGMDF